MPAYLKNSSKPLVLLGSCAFVILSGCRYGYDPTPIDEVESTGGASAGTRTSSDGTVWEGGAPGDAGSHSATGGTGSSSSDVGGGPASGGANAGSSGGDGGAPASGSSSVGAASGSAGTGGTSGSGGAVTTVGGSGGAAATTSGSGGGTVPDMNSCVEDSYGGHDYLLCAERRPWAEAAAGCALVGMSLTRIEDLAENQWLAANRDVTGSGAPPNLWIGASDAGVEGEWRWTDGDLFWSGDHQGMAENGLFVNWYDREPNDVDLAQDEDCGSLGSNRPEWFDSACTQLYPYVCESE